MAIVEVSDLPDEPLKLWGMSGGQLEYVSQRIEVRKRVSKGETMTATVYYNVMVIRFTDHDHCRDKPEENSDLVEGKYYEFEFPIFEG